MHKPRQTPAWQSRYPGADMLTRTRNEIRSLDEEMTELSLLLPDWQAQSLEAVARSEGVSAGQIVRRLILEYCGVRLNRFAVE
jgi:hypothetical protein